MRPSSRPDASTIGGDLKGKWILTAGLGGMGGAQPLAATMAGASMPLAIECQPSRIEMRLKTGYLDEMATDLDEALKMIESAWTPKRRPCRSACSAMPPSCLPEMVRRGIRPDIVTDQTSAHDPVNGYLPAGWTLDQWERANARATRKAVEAAAQEVHARACRGHGGVLERWRADPRLWQQHPPGGIWMKGLRTPFDFPGFVPAYIRPLFCRGIGPFRWCGAFRRSRRHLQAPIRRSRRTHSGQSAFAQLAGYGARAHSFPGPAGPHLLGGPGRAPQAGPGIQRNGGKWRVEGADCHRPRSSGFRIGGVSPNRETEAMKDGSDAVADWPLLNGPAQHGLGRNLGLDPSWRGRGHRFLAAFRHGDLLRWQ